jgi:hypothetical protein
MQEEYNRLLLGTKNLLGLTWKSDIQLSVLNTFSLSVKKKTSRTRSFMVNNVIYSAELSTSAATQQPRVVLFRQRVSYTRFILVATGYYVFFAQSYLN